MIKTKLGTRMFSVLMVLTMLLSLLPMTAFAKNSKSSAVTLAEGTYTVTANLYVPGELNKIITGLQAYLTNPELPPITPAEQNAKLTVDKNGVFLEITELNSIFTLQEIGDCTNAEIIESTKTDNINFANGTTDDITTRIGTLKIKLNDFSGTYTFNKCREYPTLLANSTLQGFWDVPLTLDVDFDSASIYFDPDADGMETFDVTDSGSGVNVKVSTSDQQMKNAINDAKLSVYKTTNDSSVTALLNKKYDKESSYTEFKVSMNQELTGNTQATIELPTDLTTAIHVYKLNENNTLSEVGYYQWNSSTKTKDDPNSPDPNNPIQIEVNTKNVTLKNNKVSFTATTLGTYIIMDIHDNFEIQQVTYPNTGNGISYTFTDSLRYTSEPTNYETAKSFKYHNVQPLTPKVEIVNNGTAYSVGFSTGEKNDYYLNANYSLSRSNKAKYDENIPSYKLELTVPKPEGENLKAYFITEDTVMFNSPSYAADELQYKDNLDGTITVMVCENTDQDYKTALNRIQPMQNRVAGKTVFKNSDGVSGYVLLTDKNLKSLPIVNYNSSHIRDTENGKVCGSVLYYYGDDWIEDDLAEDINDGLYMIIPSEMDNFTDLLPKEMLNAGLYDITIPANNTADENTYWADGTPANQSKILKLRVYKNALSATYNGETIHVGETPKLEIKTSGWSDNLKNDANSQPTLKAPSELKVGKYELTPDCPELENYYWVVKSGTLTVLPQGANDTDQLAEIPTAITGLTYNGSEQTGVADPDENAGYTITGNKGTDAKTYTAVASLKDGYWWMDGTREDKTITWTIEANKEPDSPVVKVYENITANLSVPGELNTQLPGVTAYMTNPDNPLGIVPDGYESVNAVAPTTPVKNNATLTEYADRTYTLTLNVPNPVFTLQKISDCSNAEIISATRDDKIYSGNTGVSRTGRITKLTIKLKDNSGTYVFNDCTEFPTLLETDWNVPLTLKVDFPSDDNNTVDTSNITIVSDIEKTTDNTPAISIKGISSEAKDYFKSLLTKEDVEKIASADNKLTFKLTAGNITDTVSSDDKNMVSDALNKNSLNNYVIGQYLDINAALSTVNKNISSIENGGTVTLSVKLDNSLINKDANRTYKIVRISDNGDGTQTTSILDTTYDSITGSIKFDTDKFSTFVIVYSDNDNNNEVINPGNNTSGDSDVKTGDTSNSLIYIIVMIATLAVVGGTIVVSRKKAK